MAPTSNILPTDDGELEMEELEGLVRISNPKPPKNTPRWKKRMMGNGGVAAEVSKRCNRMLSRSKSRNRLVVLGVCLLVAVFFSMTRVDETAEGLEQSLEMGEEEVKNTTATSNLSGLEQVDAVKAEEPAKEEEVAKVEEPATTTTTEPEKEKEAEAEVKEPETETKVEEEPATVTEPATPGTETETKVAADNSEPPAEDIDDGGWGHWKFYDGAADERPSPDFLDEFPNKDVPADKFPTEAWQADAVYVNHFLEEAENLIARAKEAILTEYGHGLPRTPEESVAAQHMFKIQILNLTSDELLQRGGRSRAEWQTQGGWTTERSFEGLSRRLLHAMMTKSTFSFVMGGHSAAAGHGNHFLQSYMMQFHTVMEPVFERLGMKLISRNIGQGGLGTMQNALGSKSIYGDELDMVLWDSSMTENGAHELDLFFRQVLLAGKRVPFLMCSGCNSEVLKMLHEEGKADVSAVGDGTFGVPEVEDAIQALEIPWAARYMKCGHEASDLCGTNKYNGTCWIDRDDVTPPVAQLGAVPGGASWHPGWRSHQLQGRVLAIWVLDALYDAVQLWQDITVVEGDPLADDYWHMTDYYDNIQKAVKEMPESYCEGTAEALGYPKRICKIGLDGKTEHTPRAFPDESSLRSIIIPPADEFMPKQVPELYSTPDVPNPTLLVPEGSTDVRKILSTRRRTRHERGLKQDDDDDNDNDNHDGPINQQSVRSASGAELSEQRQLVPEASKYGRLPGKGWFLSSHPSGFCDGSWYSQCGREEDQNCLLRAHNDQRGTLLGDGLSGWLLLKLGKVTHGIIMIHIDYWHGGGEQTKDWTEVNDGEYERQRHLLRSTSSAAKSNTDPIWTQNAEHGGMPDDFHKMPFEDGRSDHRDLGKAPHFLQDNFLLEIAINDKVTTYNKDQYAEAQKGYERVLTVIVAMDDEAWTEQDVELGIRVTGCKRDEPKNYHCSVGIGHVYWG